MCVSVYLSLFLWLRSRSRLRSHLRSHPNPNPNPNPNLSLQRFEPLIAIAVTFRREVEPAAIASEQSSFRMFT